MLLKQDWSIPGKKKHVEGGRAEDMEFQGQVSKKEHIEFLGVNLTRSAEWNFKGCSRKKKY